MVNLRFHIVSITAVFLALAIGIFMGTSLLKRATVDSLKATQHNLETKIDQSQDENAALRDALGTDDEQTRSFGSNALGSLLGGQVHDPVLLVAARGIDEDAVSAVRNVLTDAGSANLGTIWLDDKSSLADGDLRQAVATALGTGTGNATVMRKRFIDAFGGALRTATVRSAPPADTASDPATTTTTTTTVPDVTVGVDPNPVVTALIKSGVITWDAPAQGEPEKLPLEDLRVVVISGEGSTVDATKVLYPLIRATAGGAPGSTLAGEIMDARSSVAQVQRQIDQATPARGAFVGPIRRDSLHTSVATIDNLDSPYGRLSLVLDLAATPGNAIGAYGVAAGADAQYPSGTR
jgi:hypothetical protein